MHSTAKTGAEFTGNPEKCFRNSYILQWTIWALICWNDSRPLRTFARQFHRISKRLQFF